MGLFKRKKKQSSSGEQGPLSSLQREAEAAPVNSTTRLILESAPENSPPLQAQQSSQQQSPQQSRQESIQRELSPSQPSQDAGQEGHHQGQQGATAEEVVGMDLLDPGLIGRTIKIVKTDDWEDDLIHVPDKETQILYENQRGFFFFGKPYFSCDTLIQSIKFDPPPYQKTSTFFLNPPAIDPSDPHATQPHHLHRRNNPNINNPTSNPTNTSKKSKKGTLWPPDPSKLYYSPYSPSTGILSLDSCKGSSWHWTQDRWYVDMRGDVDEEGWEYAFYWGGRYWWIGGNWHGKHVFLHAWVRRRRWVRGMERLPPREHKPHPAKDTETVGKLGGGGFEALLSQLRNPQSSNQKRKLLKDFFDSALSSTMEKLPDYVQRIYMLLDPISTGELISLVEGRVRISQEGNTDRRRNVNDGVAKEGQERSDFNHGKEEENALATAYSIALAFLFSKREACIFHPGRLTHLKTLPPKQWSAEGLFPQSPTTSDQPRTESPGSFPTRRTRLRLLRSQWYISHTSPAKLVRRVRFAGGEGVFDEETGEEYVTAPERMSLGSRSSSLDSNMEKWFVAPQEQSDNVERARSVGGLIRQGRTREEAVVEDGDVREGGACC